MTTSVRLHRRTCVFERQDVGIYDNSYDDDILPISPVSAHVDKVKARGARVEWRPLRGPTHYDVSAYVPALRETSTWLAQLGRRRSVSRTLSIDGTAKFCDLQNGSGALVANHSPCP